MAYIRLYKQNDQVCSIPLKNNLNKIGRGHQSDIQLDDVTLSRPHCYIVFKDDAWYLENISKNGVLDSSRNPLEGRVKIKSGIRYQIGRLYSFEMSSEDRTAEEKTLILSQSPTQILSGNLVSKKIIRGKAVVTGKLADGTEFEKTVSSAGLNIGSHPTNDLIYPSDTMSRFHARIELIDNEFILTDLSSTNGTSINSVAVIKAKIPGNAKLQIGPYELKFEVIQEEIELSPLVRNRLDGLVSDNKEMRTLFSLIEAVSSTDAPVVIRGESGTGKELIARAIHRLSLRESGVFMALNCAALPKDLVESELFGYEKGAFTGAVQTHIGAFEAAHNGTLFLDEIGDLDLAVQAKLLRALESREIRRVGSTQIIPISVRVVAASHKNLKIEIEEGRFREDLFYRLNVVEAQVPPLRDRKEDIDILIPELLRQLGLSFLVSDQAIDLLRSYSFPGNVRELKNILQRAHIEYEIRCAKINRQLPKVLEQNDFNFLLKSADAQLLLSKAQKEEITRIKKALEDAEYQQNQASKILKMPVSTLNDKIKRYGLKKRA